MAHVAMGRDMMPLNLCACASCSICTHSRVKQRMRRAQPHRYVCPQSFRIELQVDCPTVGR
ncbi:hypothetical protein EXIGLDRAFT_322099 [Exidia glandulosa HHB12029]|uniref:Uncharacterized protein n=1 Tax=Exidia glandulosa HHB12029 TaxID=1314781 RepID=A0A165LS39_EXIGL|nr:hypothetical protein EXIGLDRAFT_322099 [Exidia glandulosa HHB12029]